MYSYIYYMKLFERLFRIMLIIRLKSYNVLHYVNIALFKGRINNFGSYKNLNDYNFSRDEIEDAGALVGLVLGFGLSTLIIVPLTMLLL